MTLIQLIKPMLSSTGTIIKSIKGKGFNCYNLNPETLDIDAINEFCIAEGIAMEATHFPAEESFHPKTGEKISSDESIYVGPPQDNSTPDSELEALVSSYKS